MMDYYIILIVGLIVLSGLMIFLDEGEKVVDGVKDKYATMESKSDKASELGSFKK